MSPIGRVFIVLNLVLAGTFVGFAGTFLQKHTNWQTQYNQLKENTDKEKVALNQLIQQKDTELGTAQREVTRLDSLQRQTQNSLDEARRTNEGLEKQVSDLTGDIKSLNSSYATVASKVEKASDDSAKAIQMALAAEEEKNKALNAKVDLEAKLAEANAKISGQEKSIADLNGSLATLQGEVRQRDILIQVAKTRMPSIFTDAQPDIAGRVENVDALGNLVTIMLTDGQKDCQPGHRLALYNDRAYLGEAVVTDVKGEFAFARITAKPANASVKQGDRAKTNLSR
ncbi:MAG: hypothetical protein IT458_02775 [Planctomycetes bacterium]|nr:hypothetical protein [Planctomycetota bacterium]